MFSSPESHAAQEEAAPDSASSEDSSPAVRASDVPEFGALDPKIWTTVGSVVPELELPLVDGSGVFDLASLRGKKVLLIQFASW